MTTERYYDERDYEDGRDPYSSDWDLTYDDLEDEDDMPFSAPTASEE